ncbi:MAG: OST-HTH/LOTUS domain-containing protein, partial [Neoaquamicrobium sediminum]
ESFRQACRRFTYTENLLPDAPANVESAGSSTKPLQSPNAAAPIIRRVLDQMETEDGWAPLGAVGTQLANLSSDFDPRNFGFRKLSDLVRKTDAFEIEHLEGGGVRIRKKPAPTKASAKRRS